MSVEEVMAGLAASAKYRDLAPAALERTARWALERHRRPAEALKAAKRKLHQAFGAYLAPGAVAAVHRILDDLGETPERTEVEAACRRILSLHRSTAERLSLLPGFYDSIFAATGMPEEILDIAAGLSPFALPFMGLPPATRYSALEVDRGLAEAAGRLLRLLGRPGEVIWADAVSELPATEADLALVLKTLPCLEQQADGAARALLDRLAGVGRIVVSYPVRSLGGHDKGMAATYEAQITALAREVGRPLLRLDITGELIVILGRAQT